ncbi:hypothetical protein IIC65_01215 [Candidatus Sumerlaeota bacterium]|nr:hypothetical protein [Candidatus Sumerlaeota bacterium]
MNSLFEAIFGPLNAALGAIPFSAARWITVTYLILHLIGASMLSRDYVFIGAPRRVWYLDLRLWAVLCMLPYILIYLYF